MRGQSCAELKKEQLLSKVFSSKIILLQFIQQKVTNFEKFFEKILVFQLLLVNYFG